MHSLTSEVDQKIAEGNLALWMQLGIAPGKHWPRAPGCVVPCSMSPQAFPEAAIQILQSDLEVDPRWQPFAEDLRQRIDFPVFGIAARPPLQTQTFLDAAGFPSN